MRTTQNGSGQTWKPGLSLDDNREVADENMAWEVFREKYTTIKVSTMRAHMIPVKLRPASTSKAITPTSTLLASTQYRSAIARRASTSKTKTRASRSPKSL